MRMVGVERYAALLARVKQLKRGKQRATQQLAHYSVRLSPCLPFSVNR